MNTEVLILVSLLNNISTLSVIFLFLVIHSFNLSFADDFDQICRLYHHEDGFILPQVPNSLFKFDDYAYEETDIEDFYFSVPRLLVYQ